MRTIAITNQKGGSGKTTTVVNLAAALAERNRGILIIDLDSQASATAWVGVENPPRTILDFFYGRASLDSVIYTIAGKLDIIPSTPLLAGIDTALADKPGSKTLLRRGLEAVDGRYDYVLIDCPPSLGILTVNALAASGEVLIPVEASILAFSGLVQLLHTIRMVKDQLNPDLSITGILACRVDSRTRHAGEIVDLLREKHKREVFRTVIHESVRLRESPGFGPILEYATTSTGAIEYRALAAEIINQEKKHR